MSTFDVFGRRQREERERLGERLPPGQKPTDGWPVLNYGGIPRIDAATWRFRVWGLVEEDKEWTWDEFLALPQISDVSDIHCVTQWSKFDNEWEGISWRELLRHVKPLPDAKHVMAHCYGGYTTNIALADLDDDDVLFAFKHNGQPLAPEHGGPMRLVVPKLYFWKSAKWIRGVEFIGEERPGFWEMYGYHIHGDPWKEERYS